MVWLVDYSDLNNLSMTQIAAERFLHDGGFDATGRYLLIAANMRDQMVVIDTKERKFVTKFETGTKPHPRPRSQLGSTPSTDRSARPPTWVRA